MHGDPTAAPVGQEPPAAATPRQPSRWKRWLIISGGLVLIVLAVVVIAQLQSGAEDAPVIGVTTVEIRGSAFKPPVIQVDQGMTVTWAFTDLEAHNVTGDGWGSDLQREGEFMHTFTAPGSFSYECTLHAWMDGRVEVVARGATG